MARIAHVLQIAGLVIAPLGLVHYFTTRDYVSESSLMTWELGLLTLGAACFLLGQTLKKK